MKILSDEEKNAHWNAIIYDGAKGCLIGAGISYGLVTFLKKKHAARYSQFNTSIKTCLWTMPVIAMGAFFADEGSVKFDEQWHRSDYLKEVEKEKLEKWNQLTWEDKAFKKVNENKYKIILGAWVASLWGSWKIVDKDKYMTKAQKAVQARVYAQAVTVVLLLGTILLNMRENEIKKKEPKEIPEWQKFLNEQASKTKEQAGPEK